MNTFQKIITGICILSIPFLGSCGKKDPVSCNYVTELQNELNAVSNAATIYGNDPSTVNCNAFKAAYQAYINALKDHSGCVPAGQEATYQQAIDDSQAAIDGLQC